jgi:glyoxylase-like metal-dependent hydrolase (beta-lactamase superfamily II)
MSRIEVAQIADGLYVIPVGPVNTFLLDSPDGCALIDTGVSGSVGAILRAFAADTCMNVMGLGWTMGYEDFEEGQRSLEKLAQLDFRVACFGHGQTILHDAGDRFRKMWAASGAQLEKSNSREHATLNAARSGRKNICKRMDKAMRMTLPGTVRTRQWQRSSGTPLSVKSKTAQISSIELRENAVHDAGPRSATPATVAAPASLQRSDLLFFLRSITESPRHK